MTTEELRDYKLAMERVEARRAAAEAYRMKPILIDAVLDAARMLSRKGFGHVRFVPEGDRYVR